MIHKLKTWPKYFWEVAQGSKTCEVRKNDRNYQTGDILILQEYDPDKQEYTGNEITVRVTHVIDDQQFAKDGYVVMSIRKMDAATETISDADGFQYGYRLGD